MIEKILDRIAVAILILVVIALIGIVVFGLQELAAIYN